VVLESGGIVPRIMTRARDGLSHAAPPAYTRGMSCLFCRIVSGEIPATKVFEDDDVVAFEDINPQAPLHVLVVPRRHVATLNDLGDDHDRLVGVMVRRAAAIAGQRGVAARGYRAVFNCNGDAGQTVFHLHLHVLGGRSLAWPPG
jgi:histidine triad (HIT) family protein